MIQILATIHDLVTAIALWLLWGWFVVPLGAPVLNVFHVYGLSLLLSRFPDFSDKDDRAKLEWLVGAILHRLVVIAAGFALSFGVTR